MSPPVPQTVVIGKKSQFRLKDHPGRLSFSYADILAFLFSVDKSIGSGCFFQDLDPSVNLIGHAAITIPENCSAHVPMILKEFCSSKINGLVMKIFSGK
jgi:hypothetical protein